MCDIKIKDMDFPRSCNKDVWNKYLNEKMGRNLKKDEEILLQCVKLEKYFNDKTKELHEVAKKKGLYICKLTELFGNCLFESLSFLDLADTEDDLRKATAHIMYMYQDYEGLFSGVTETLKEIFDRTNEVEYVVCRDDNKPYKYTYNVMCQDLSKDTNWSRLPTQLILMVLSVFCNVVFVIISNNSEYEHVISGFDEKENAVKPKIYLGHIGESHYCPIKKKTGHPSEEECPTYIDSTRDFFKWARHIWIKCNNKIEPTTSNSI